MEPQYYVNLQRLSELTQKIHSGLGTKAEKDEFMMLIYKNGSITQARYNDYLKGKNQQQLLNAGLGIAALIFLGRSANRAASSKNNGS